VLSGFLECAVCGGGFHAQNSAERYGCGWHRGGRDPVVCENALLVPRRALEDRIFGAILVPEVVSLAVERAADLVYAELAAPKPTDLRDRLEEIEEELATPRRVAARRGRRQELSRVVTELEAERARLSGAFTGAETPAEIAPEVLRPRSKLVCGRCVRRLKRQFRTGEKPFGRFSGTGECGSVRTRSADSGSRGVFALALEVPNARPLEDAGRRQSVVAGGCFYRSEERQAT
jgi:hypothetical protein